jgi:hypothetical protein
VSLTFHSALRKLNTEPSIGASNQILVHLAKQIQRKRFLEIDQPEKEFPLAAMFAVFYKECSFRPDLLINMATTSDSCF